MVVTGRAVEVFTAVSIAWITTFVVLLIGLWLAARVVGKWWLMVPRSKWREFVAAIIAVSAGLVLWGLLVTLAGGISSTPISPMADVRGPSATASVTSTPQFTSPTKTRVRPTNSPQTQVPIATVKSQGLNIRAGPGVDYLNGTFSGSSSQQSPGPTYISR
jgi:hypothetical protein